jgi:hypothetical protein
VTLTPPAIVQSVYVADAATTFAFATDALALSVKVTLSMFAGFAASSWYCTFVIV